MTTFLLAKIQCYSPLRVLDEVVRDKEDILRLLVYAVSAGVTPTRINQLSQQINSMPNIDLDDYTRILDSCIEIGNLVMMFAYNAGYYYYDFVEEPAVILRSRVGYNLIFEFIPGSKDFGHL